MSKKEEILNGVVENITYRNDETGYCVVELGLPDDIITVVGVLPFVNVGEHLALKGEHTVHPQYGQQFRADFAERSLPNSSAEILKYLSSGAVKGIGPATAQTIVAKFGEKTLEIIENNAEELAKIRGISPKKAKIISDDYNRQFGVRRVMLSLGQFNITAAEALKIYKNLGMDSTRIVTENPYILCGDGIGFSFVRADEIAMSQEGAANTEFRIPCGIEFVLKHNRRNGHTCLPKEKLIQTAANMLACSAEECEEALKNMISDGRLCAEVFGELELVFLPSLYNAERYCANRLALMRTAPPPPVAVSVTRLEQIERETGILYDELQKEACAKALSNGLLVLTGGPGTGKTTTVSAIITLLEESGLKIALCAPTGRAAKRMSELCGREAKTIHRLLEVEWGDGDRPFFTRDEGNPLVQNCIIVDELSMLDIGLFEALLKAMKSDCRLVLVGDVDQLPSVGAGNVLCDIIESGAVPTVRLGKVFRQAEESYIVTNAHRIIAGEMPILGGRDSDFFITKNGRPDKLVVQLCSERLPGAYSYTPENIQVLCPARIGFTGTNNINTVMQGTLNPEDKSKKELRRRGCVLREGDKVMQIKNNYQVPWKRDNGEEGEGVFNGDIGVLVGIDKLTPAISVRFDDKIAAFTGEDIDNIELAYAITVHKSQGSEFDCVVLPLCDIPGKLCYRNLLYTAVTRARKHLIIVGSSAEIKRMIDNNKKTKRYTAFGRMLKNSSI